MKICTFFAILLSSLLPLSFCNEINRTSAAVREDVSWSDVKDFETYGRGNDTFTNDSSKYKHLNYLAGASSDITKTAVLDRYNYYNNKKALELSNFNYTNGLYIDIRPKSANTYLMYEIHVSGYKPSFNSNGNVNNDGLVIGFPVLNSNISFNETNHTATFNDASLFNSLWKNSLEINYNSLRRHFLNGGTIETRYLTGYQSLPYCIDNVTIFVMYGKNKCWVYLEDKYGNEINHYYDEGAGNDEMSDGASVVSILGNQMNGSYTLDKFVSYEVSNTATGSWSKIFESAKQHSSWEHLLNDSKTLYHGYKTTYGPDLTNINVITLNGLKNYNSADGSGMLFRDSGIDSNVSSFSDAKLGDLYSNRLIGKVECNFNLDYAASNYTNYHKTAFGIMLGQKEKVLDASNNSADNVAHYASSDSSLNGTFIGIYKNDDDPNSNKLRLVCLSGSSYGDPNSGSNPRLENNLDLKYKINVGSHKSGDSLKYNDVIGGYFTLTVHIFESVTSPSTYVDLMVSIRNNYAAPGVNPEGFDFMVYRFVNIAKSYVDGFTGFGSMLSSQYDGGNTTSKYALNKIFTTINSYVVFSAGNFRQFYSGDGNRLFFDGENASCAFTIACPDYHMYLGNDLSAKSYRSLGYLSEPFLMVGKKINPGTGQSYILTKYDDPTFALSTENEGNLALKNITSLSNDDSFYINLNSMHVTTLEDSYVTIKNFKQNYKIYYNYSTKKFVLGTTNSTPENCTPNVVIMVNFADYIMRQRLANITDLESTETTFMRPWHTTNDMNCATCGYYRETKNALVTWGDTAINMFRNCWYYNDVVNGYSCSPVDQKGDSYSLVARYEAWGRICGDTGEDLYQVTNQSPDILSLRRNETSNVLNVIFISLSITALLTTIVIVCIKRKKEINK